MRTKSERPKLEKKAIESELEGTEAKRTLKRDKRELLACRVCLCTNKDLNSLFKCRLDETFRNITGTPLSLHDGLPQHMCSICKRLLLKCASFIAQSQKTYQYLQAVTEQRLQLTTAYISNIGKDNLKVPLMETQALILDHHPENPDAHKVSDAKIDIRSPTKNTHNNTNDTNTIPFVCVEIKQDIETGDEMYRDTHNLQIDEDIKQESATANVKTIEREAITKRKYVTSEDYKKFSKIYEVDVAFLDTKQQIESLVVLKNTESFKRSRYKCQMCYKGFKTESVFENHMDHHDFTLQKSGKYECDICHLRYSTRNKMAAHVKNHKMRFICRLCGVSSKCGTSAILHYKWHKGIKYSCKHCKKNFSSQSCHHSHVRQVHKKVNCGVCGATFTGTDALTEHAQAHPQPHKCSTCQMGFQNTDALDKHQCNMSSCSLCGENFTTEDLLEQHRVKTHEGKKCDECGSIWKNEIALKNHWSHAHRGVRRETDADRADRKLICEVCAKTCKNSYLLKAHQQIHTDDRPFLCTLCPKRFRDRWALQEHTNHHTGARPHNCPQCQETFKSYNEKSLHKQMVHKKDHRCLQCDKIFLSISELKRHQHIHSGEKAFKCSSCPKQFTHKMNLKSHVNNVHSGARLFKCTSDSCSETFTTYRKRHEHNLMVHKTDRAHKCPMCEKLFMTPSELANHRRSHTGEKPFKCSLCSKTFGRKSTLQVHMNSHTGVRPYKCPFCSEAFSSYWRKSQHKITVHMKKPLRVRDRIKCLNDE